MATVDVSCDVHCVLRCSLIGWAISYHFIRGGDEAGDTEGGRQVRHRSLRVWGYMTNPPTQARMADDALPAWRRMDTIKGWTCSIYKDMRNNPKRSFERTAHMSIDPKELRTALGRFATGVTVVTAKTWTEARGMTANAFSSLSLDPPLVLVCFDNKASSLRVVREAGKFAVNFLAEEQKGASDWFAGKGRDSGDQFANIVHEMGENGSPLLTGNAGVLECDLHEEFPGGDHTIVVGRVTRVLVDEEICPPLLFYGSAYRKMDMDGVYD